MAMVTKVMLEHQNAMLRSDIRSLRADLTIAQERATLYRDQHSMLTKYLSTMTIAVERVTDAMSHAIGFVTDPQRQKHTQRIANEVYKEKYSIEEKE